MWGQLWVIYNNSFCWGCLWKRALIGIVQDLFAYCFVASSHLLTADYISLCDYLHFDFVMSVFVSQEIME
jgi:hypothetical protein